MKLKRSKNFFKILQKAFLVSVLASSSFLLVPLCYSQDKLEDLSQEESEAKLDKLKAGIKKMTNWLLQANDEKTGLNKELEQNEKKINVLSKQIRTGNQQIKENEQTLSELKKELENLSSKLKVHGEFLQKQIQIAYFQEEHSKIKLLLNTDNPQDIARQMRYFDYIKDARKEKIDEVKQLLSKIQTTEKNIQQKTASLSRQTNERESRQIELSKTLKTKKALLTKLEKSITNNAQRLEKMQADQKRLTSLLEELETSLANIPMPSDSAPFAQQKSKLPWPSHGKVIAEYGSSVAEGKLHLNGLRIASKDNDPVKSIYSGRVIFSNWIRGFGLLIIVDHGDEFMSLYGNNKSLTKETGDWVRVGETIAISSEYTLSQESGLYFEIRKKGKPINPRQWLR